MNKSNLKSYAPRARKDFIAAVTARAHLLGLDQKAGQLEVAPSQTQGDVTIIGGQAWPASVGAQREQLIARMQREGFAHTLEAVAYTWFNRFAALRYMELHDYLGHGHRALSSREGGLPEILTHAADLAQSGAEGGLPGLKPAQVTEMKLAGNRDGELYRLLLIAQCNALHSAMPFLFERIDDETELLLPDNLLLSDSVVAKLVSEIPEEDWAEVEIIGWLYQFYISEKKDQVIGKVVASEDIPAATQLFTPNWIVKYMVQNSLGAQWLATYPQSPLRGQMAYYIEPAEQTDEVKAQLAAITPSQLNPEELTLIDPASGSGHILVEAYELFKAIYLERGYRPRDVPQLILEKNLFGLDIDERAAQLSGFALMMKGRADDRQLFERGVKLNVMALVNSAGFDAEALANGVPLSDYGLKLGDLTELKLLFEHATTFGSLIQVPDGLAKALPALRQLSEATGQDLFVSEGLERLEPLVQQAELLAAQYDAVVANPPYMGAKSFCSELKDWLAGPYGSVDKDLFSAFIVRLLAMTRAGGHSGVMTQFVWMFIATFEPLRDFMFARGTIGSLVQLHYDAFADAKAHICTFVTRAVKIDGHKGNYIRLTDFPGADNQGPRALEAIVDRGCGWFFEAVQDDFRRVPGMPVAYWIPFLHVFDLENLGTELFSGGRIKTHNGPKYLRYGWEVSRAGNRWRQIVKGGDYRKHAGNEDFVVDWSPEALAFYEAKGGLYPKRFLEREGICWSKITSATPSFRMKRSVSEYDSASPTIFNDDFHCDAFILALLNSPVSLSLLQGINPTVNTQVADVLALPLCLNDRALRERVGGAEMRLVNVALGDWEAYEGAWDFQSLPILAASSEPVPTLESSYAAWISQNRDTIAEMKRLEEENNRLFIDAYGLADELTPEVPIEQITLTVNPAYRYGGKLTEEELWTRFRQDSMEELVSYAIGCMMGRYSLDAPGLIYAHSGNQGFDPDRYSRFPADADGIVPITDELWFEDDATNRVREFLRAVWGAATLEQNMAWLAGNLGSKNGELPEDTIRRYLADKFFKDHLQTYKKRPIYWLFSSGKQGAFQALVYLHRYNEGTLARLRAEYVVPLTGKIQSRIESLQKDIDSASSTAARNKLSKELEKLKKKHTELLTYDEKLRHYADMRIQLDLDDGVKVNYGKFGDLLAEVKAVTGGKDEE